jgi:hypothetical protein
MLRLTTTMFALLVATAVAHGQEAEPTATNDDHVIGEQLIEEAATKAQESDEQPVKDQGDGIKSPKTMSGMSILGNEEAPKSLVIIPWKSSELGDTISLSDTLDERARPVDKDVFMRELSFYEIRSGN